MLTSAGILVVHAHLDARIALRKPTADTHKFRRTAIAALLVLLCAAATALILKRALIDHETNHATSHERNGDSNPDVPVGRG